jgi:hypothetical protein
MLGDIHHPQPVRFSRVEVAPDEIVGGFAAVAARAAPTSTTVDARHAGLAHQSLDRLA